MVDYMNLPGPEVSKGIFIASPFFNSEQVMVVKMIENILDEKGVPYFSARKDTKVAPDSSQHDRKLAFTANCMGIKERSVVLAVVDWLLPENQEMRIVEFDAWNRMYKESMVGQSFPAWIRSPKLYVPDMGTVFEIGYANAIKKPVIALRVQNKMPINLMLAEAFVGMMYDLHTLTKFVRDYPRGFHWKELEKWKGHII